MFINNKENWLDLLKFPWENKREAFPLHSIAVSTPTHCNHVATFTRATWDNQLCSYSAVEKRGNYSKWYCISLSRQSHLFYVFWCDWLVVQSYFTNLFQRIIIISVCFLSQGVNCSVDKELSLQNRQIEKINYLSGETEYFKFIFVFGILL